jgi:membrane protease YdiL (CAAX protease family)
LVAGLLLGVVVGRVVAERPYHLKRLLPRHWRRVARRMKREHWIRLFTVALWVAVISLIFTLFISPLVFRPEELVDPEEYPFIELQRKFPWLMLIAVNILPIFEEWVFRGILIDELTHRRGSKMFAVVISSFVFAMFHLSNPGTYPPFALVLFPTSLLLGICYLKVGLGGAILAHNSYNSFLVITGMIT